MSSSAPSLADQSHSAALSARGFCNEIGRMRPVEFCRGLINCPGCVYIRMCVTLVFICSFLKRVGSLYEGRRVNFTLLSVCSVLRGSNKYQGWLQVKKKYIYFLSGLSYTGMSQGYAVCLYSRTARVRNKGTKLGLILMDLLNTALWMGIKHRYVCAV